MSRETIFIYCAAILLGIAVGFVYKFLYNKNAASKIQTYQKEIERSMNKIKALEEQNKNLEQKLSNLEKEGQKKTA